MAVADHRCFLHHLLQDKCRTNVELTYIYPSRNQAILWVANKPFTGEVKSDVKAARQSAAKVAYEALNLLSEAEIRQICGLPQRQLISEIDNLRDALRQLRSRANRELNGGARKRAGTKVGNLYVAIDALEKELMQLGLGER